MTVLITFFPITITVYDGLQSARVEMMELLLTYGATKRDIFCKIKVPCTLPYFFSAIKMAIPMSIIGAAIGEWLGAQSGLVPSCCCPPWPWRRWRWWRCWRRRSSAGGANSKNET